MANDSKLIYVHDPMCSWCWGHRREWEKLEAALENKIAIQYCVGGLAADCDEPMPISQQAAITGYWRKIQSLLGTEFNFDFWELNTPRRSTYPACRATIAARWQDAEKAMIIALQKAYYLEARNPSDRSVLIALAAELDLDLGKFERDLKSAELNSVLFEEIKFSKTLPIRGFPSMVLLRQRAFFSIQLDYQDYRSSLDQILGVLAG